MWKKLKIGGDGKVRALLFIHIYAFTMDCDPKVKRSKKKDKAKEKVGMPSAKYVRLQEAAHVKVPLNIKLSLHPNG